MFIVKYISSFYFSKVNVLKSSSKARRSFTALNQKREKEKERKRNNE
jgi:hypothetical protein